ncbi:MAG: hypothetical protein KJ645_00955, partial [Planctomycetes bacterium]|nr:hypothetical protein [Planctomycetota bacterium]
EHVILLDGRRKITAHATVKKNRPDVAEAFKNGVSDRYGWELIVKRSVLTDAPETYKIGVYVPGKDKAFILKGGEKFSEFFHQPNI